MVEQGAFHGPSVCPEDHSLQGILATLEDQCSSLRATADELVEQNWVKWFDTFACRIFNALKLKALHERHEFINADIGFWEKQVRLSVCPG